MRRRDELEAELRPNRRRNLGYQSHVRESDDDAYVVELDGEIDVYTSPKVKDAITRADRSRPLQPRDQPRESSLHRFDRARRADRRPQARARARRYRQSRLHEPADQEDLRHHGPGQDLRHLRRRGGARRRRSRERRRPTRRALGTVELRIPREPEWVAVARLAVAGVANRLRFSVEDIEDIKLAIAEACTTCIQDAAGRRYDRHHLRSEPTRCAFACAITASARRRADGSPRPRPVTLERGLGRFLDSGADGSKSNTTSIRIPAWTRHDQARRRLIAMTRFIYDSRWRRALGPRRTQRGVRRRSPQLRDGEIRAMRTVAGRTRRRAPQPRALSSRSSSPIAAKRSTISFRSARSA